MSLSKTLYLLLSYLVKHMKIENHTDMTEKLLTGTYSIQTYKTNTCTVVPTKSDSDVIFCLQLFSKTLT